MAMHKNDPDVIAQSADLPIYIHNISKILTPISYMSLYHLIENCFPIFGLKNI